MIQRIYAIHDVKVKAYAAPFFMRTNEEALRAFGTACQDETTKFSKHPEDFTLVQIGMWDEQDGVIEGQAPVILARADEYRVNQS